MSPQCSYFQNYSDLLTLLQCQRVTNVTIAQYMCILIFFFFFFFFFGAEIPRQIIVKSASDAEKQRLYIGDDILHVVAQVVWSCDDALDISFRTVKPMCLHFPSLCGHCKSWIESSEVVQSFSQPQPLPIRCRYLNCHSPTINVSCWRQ